MIGKTILYTGRCRKNATVSESFDCQEEERIDLLPEVTDKRWLPAFFHIDSGQSYRLYAAVYIASCICKVAADCSVERGTYRCV